MSFNRAHHDDDGQPFSIPVRVWLVLAAIGLLFVVAASVDLNFR